jgi:hypothetical protein
MQPLVELVTSVSDTNAATAPLQQQPLLNFMTIVEQGAHI